MQLGESRQIVVKPSVALWYAIQTSSLWCTEYFLSKHPGRERVHRWWHTKQLADNRIIMGKPSVLFRKVVNTRVGDEMIAVNAQQYAVLVMDVPNLHKENDRCAAWLCQTLTAFMLPSPHIRRLRRSAMVAYAAASWAASFL